MAFEIKCRQCGATASFLDEALGRTERCPACGGPLELNPSEVVMTTPDIRVIEEPVASVQSSGPPVRAPVPTDSLKLSTRIQSAEAVRQAMAAQAPLEFQFAHRPWNETLKEEQPKKSRFSCGFWALMMLSFFIFCGVVAIVTVERIYHHELPTARENAARVSLQNLESAEFAFYQKTGEFASRISGFKHTLESRELVNSRLASAEAPPGAGVPLSGYLFRILGCESSRLQIPTRSFQDSRGQMTSGFAILAYPVDTRVPTKTFLRAPDGTLLLEGF